VAVGSTKFKSDTDMKQAAYHPEIKILNAHSQGVAWEAPTVFTLFRVEISPYEQFFHSIRNPNDIWIRINVARLSCQRLRIRVCPGERSS
jgi:hypothetical protein